MFIFKNAKTFVNFLNEKINNYQIDFVNNHIGFVVSNKKIVGKFEIDKDIYLDLIL